MLRAPSDGANSDNLLNVHETHFMTFQESCKQPSELSIIPNLWMKKLRLWEVKQLIT